MKFSVLLPTHNRLDLLQYAVESVIRQDYDEWELIVSDNASEDDVEGYIQSLNDKRVKYYRTPEFVSVTKNWNNVLEKATGDYVIMLGDDDCLMKGFFNIMAELIGTYESPDLIYTDAYIFGYPGVLPEHPSGILRMSYNTFFETREPFILSRATAIDLVRHALALTISVYFNMQLSVIARKFIDSLAAHGPFFQSPFPDYFATVVSFLKAERTLVYQQPVVTIGISPKSFGYYYFNHAVEQGATMLNTASEQAATSLQYLLLPGNWEYSNRLMAMHTVWTNFREELESLGIRIAYQKYRRVQIVFSLKRYYLDKRSSKSDLKTLREAMTHRERFLYGFLLGSVFRILGIFPQSYRRSLVRYARRLIRGAKQSENELWPPTDFRTILDVYENMPPVHGNVSLNVTPHMTATQDRL